MPAGDSPASTACRWGRGRGVSTRESFSIFSRSNACRSSRSKIYFIMTAA